MRNVTPMKAAKTGYIVISSLMIALGISVIAAPDLFGETVCVILGVSSAVFGAVKILSYFSKDLFRLAFQHDLAEGLALVIVGLAAAVRPQIFLGFIGIAFGLCIIIDSMLKVQTAAEAKTFGVSKWWLILAAAVITGLAGFFLLINPIDSAAVAALIFGISLMAEGLMNLVTVLVAVKIIKNQQPDDIITISAVHHGV